MPPELDRTELFTQVLGRAPTDAEAQELNRIASNLQCGSGDAMFLVLVALHGHQVLYREIPEKLAAATEAVLKSTRATAEAQVQASAKAMEAKLAEGVAVAATQVARDVAGKQRLQWIAGASATACVVLLVVGLLSFSKGKATGYTEGRQAEHDLNAWVNTPSGQAALGLAQDGTLKALATCTLSGWAAEVKNNRRACMPTAKASGYYLP